MLTTSIRKSSKMFSDPNRFPYGFKKSGDFSIEEAELLSTFGYTLTGLQGGVLPPANEEEQRFLDVLNHSLEPASKVEKVWLKYLKLTSCPRRFYTLHSSSRHTTADAANDDDDFSYQDDADIAL